MKKSDPTCENTANLIHQIQGPEFLYTTFCTSYPTAAAVDDIQPPLLPISYPPTASPPRRRRLRQTPHQPSSHCFVHHIHADHWQGTSTQLRK